MAASANKKDTIMSMNPITDYFLLGLGREGWSSYQYLKQVNPNAKFVITDDQAVGQLGSNWQRELSQNRVEYLSVDGVIKQLSTAYRSNQSVVLSPGIPLSHPLCQAIEQFKILPTSNTELFLQAVLNQPSPPLLIGVTGTKGKSTTASLIHHVLNSSTAKAAHGNNKQRSSGFNNNSKYTYHLLAGNIGTPPLEILPELQSLSQNFTQPGTVTLEMSSHQLRLLHTSPNIAVIQNISQEHLDYFGSLEKYVKAKSSIVRFQSKDDLVVFNQDLTAPSQLASLSLAKKITFVTREVHKKANRRDATNEHSETVDPRLLRNRQFQHNNLGVQRDDMKPQHVREEAANQFVAWIESGAIVCSDQPVIGLDQLPLVGRHNWQNVMPAVVIGHLLGLSYLRIADAIKTFQPLKHRLQKVAEIDGVLYVNDTLATGPAAASAALKSFSNRPIIALAGGYDRGLDLTEHIKQLLKSNIKGLILFPTTGDYIEKQLRKLAAQTNRMVDFPLHHVKSMSKAVIIAKQLAQSGDVVLLSPGAASFGLFKDYADRGEQFIERVINENNT